MTNDMGWNYINITENDNHEFTVEARLIDGTLWLSKWQMATLFNVYTKIIESKLKAIFKARLLNENEVSKIHVIVEKKYESEQILYNLDVIILVGFRVASFEAKAFREWIMKAWGESIKPKPTITFNIVTEQLLQGFPAVNLN